MFSKKIVLLAVGFTLLCVACSKPDAEELRIQLVSADQNVSRDALFLGVHEQNIYWTSKEHGTRNFSWDGTSPLPFSPLPGDRVGYTGWAGETLLVSGEAEVGTDNLLIVPLTRHF